ncbi:unnamed protein product, partial [marine sediment metagenome]
VKDRMSTMDTETVTPSQLINARPIIAAVKEFFTNSQLSQFMDQTNPLAELGHKRRLSAMGPGGLSRERAGFDVRDVHRSHYGRICPIATPEGPNIGLVGHLASFSRLNEYGFLETPYLRVKRYVKNNGKDAVGMILHKDIIDENSKKVLAKKDIEIDSNLAKELAQHKDIKKLEIKSVVTDEVVFLDAFEEDRSVTAPATTPMDEKGRFLQKMVQVRVHGEPKISHAGKIEFLDVSPKQIISVTTALIPFLEHDDANRALMGSNMQRQAVSTIKTQSPVVGTG